jgi:hypothetical protein
VWAGRKDVFSRQSDSKHRHFNHRCQKLSEERQPLVSQALGKSCSPSAATLPKAAAAIAQLITWRSLVPEESRWQL